MHCPSCGTDNPEGSKFCMTCGTKLDAAPAASEPAGATAPAWTPPAADPPSAPAWTPPAAEPSPAPAAWTAPAPAPAEPLAAPPIEPAPAWPPPVAEPVAADPSAPAVDDVAPTDSWTAIAPGVGAAETAWTAPTSAEPTSTGPEPADPAPVDSTPVDTAPDPVPVVGAPASDPRATQVWRPSWDADAPAEAGSDGDGSADEADQVDEPPSDDAAAWTAPAAEPATLDPLAPDPAAAPAEPAAWSPPVPLKEPAAPDLTGAPTEDPLASAPVAAMPVAEPATPVPAPPLAATMVAPISLPDAAVAEAPAAEPPAPVADAPAPVVAANPADPSGLGNASQPLDGAARNGIRTPLVITAALMNPGERAQHVVAGSIDGLPAALTLTDQRLVAVNQKDWAPLVVRFLVDTQLDVQAWEDESGATVVLTSGISSVTMDHIVDRTPAYTLVAAIRARTGQV